jgi:hypothetical protein
VAARRRGLFRSVDADACYRELLAATAMWFFAPPTDCGSTTTDKEPKETN